MSRAIGWAAVMSVVTASIAGAQSTDQTLDRAVAAWGKVKTARATFEQTVTNSLTGSSATAHGEYQQQRPNRVAIRFTDPSGDRIVSDGASVWVYLPSSAPGQVVEQLDRIARTSPLIELRVFIEDRLQGRRSHHPQDPCRPARSLPLIMCDARYAPAGAKFTGT